MGDTAAAAETGICALFCLGAIQQCCFTSKACTNFSCCDAGRGCCGSCCDESFDRDEFEEAEIKRQRQQQQQEMAQADRQSPAASAVVDAQPGAGPQMSSASLHA